jgi:hypothetical protein
MKRILLVLAVLALVLPALPRAQAADVSVDFFYNNLSGGSWIEVGDYGYCWQPDVASARNWRPYSDGYWAYTDLGWTWVSYENFGWATYHYGRWSRLEDQGWVWVPGRDEDLEWGPAWVSWRTGGDHIGWAPLPPSRGGVRYQDHGITGQVDIDFDIGPTYYNFVEVRYIGEPVLRQHLIEPSQNVTYINETVNVTNITYKDKVVYNYGPDVNVVNTRSTRQIQRLRLERQENADLSAAAKSGALFKPEGDRLIVSAPTRITRSTRQTAPPTVKTKVTQAKIDRGWSGVGDAKAQEEFKQRIKNQDRNKIPPPTSGATTAQSPALTSPAGGTTPATSVAPATPATSVAPAASATPFERETGKGRNRNRPGEQGSPAGTPGLGGSPAGGVSPGAGTTTPEHGKHKGRHGEEQVPSTSPSGAATTPSTLTSPGQTNTTAPERGKHRGGKQSEQTSPMVPNATSTPAETRAPGESGHGQGKHQGERNVEPGAGSQSPSSGNLSGDQGQGKHKNRHPEQPGTSPGAATGGEQTTTQSGEGAAGGKHKGRETAPTTNAPGGTEQRESRGEGKKNKAETSPVPSPQ